MKKIAVVFLFYIFYSFNGKTQTVYMDSLVPMVKHTLKDMPNGTVFSIVIVTKDAVQYIGLKKDFDEIQSNDYHNYHFEIGSITKVFTATLLSKAIQLKKVKVDRKINKDLPFNLNENIKITYQDLANHTSGLPRLTPSLMMSALLNPANPYKEYGRKDFEHYLQNELELFSKPGEKYDYSNTGAGLLAHTLSYVFNDTFENLLAEHIFSVYGMKSIGFNHDEYKNTLIKGIDAEGFEVENWSFNAMKGAGGLYAKVQDLATFAQAHFNADDELLALTREKTFSISGDFGIGLGWHIIGNENKTAYWHNGGTGGYSSSFTMNVDDQKAVIVLSNISALSSYNKEIDPLCFSLLKKLTSWK